MAACSPGPLSRNSAMPSTSQRMVDGMAEFLERGPGEHAAATEQNDIRCAFEHAHHETHIVETRRPAGEDVTLLDAFLQIETRTGFAFLDNRDLAVAAIESGENVHY